MTDPIPITQVASVGARRRLSSPARAPTEPAASHSKPTESHGSALDPDTCRICRGEAATDEPLFYPCKCSGSIKYVHQDCLMEWLSHSQKKHCELCKTPFRFTKYYSPTMPKSVPHVVFVKHVAKYIFRDLLIWLRAVLVISVWLVWLPYLMRSVWAFLFWISDEGLGGSSLFSQPNATLYDGFNPSSLPPELTTCVSSPLFAATSTIATIGGIQIPLDKLQGSGFSEKVYGINVTTSDPLSATLLRYLFGSVAAPAKSLSNNSTLTTAAVHEQPVSFNRHPSLLSEVGWLKNLTRSPSINRTVITILEGQIITVLVIVCFILIILVRDYVVQQQPEINMRAAFAAQGNNPQVEAHEQDLAPGDDAVHASDDSDGETMDTDDHADLQEEITNELRQQVDVAAPAAEVNIQAQLRPRPIAGFQRRLPRRVDLQAVEVEGAVHIAEQSDRILPSSLEDFDSIGESSKDHENSTVSEYLRIYRLAGGDPATILKMIEEEHLEDRLGYWVRITQSTLNRSQAGTDSPNTTNSTHRRSPAQLPEENDAVEGLAAGWGDDALDALPPVKGKGKHVESADVEDEETAGLFMPSHSHGTTRLSSPAVLAPKPLRPRAVSDGPPLYQGLNPLANGTWSFSAIPEVQQPYPDELYAERENSGSSQNATDDHDYPTPPSSTAAEHGSPSYLAQGQEHEWEESRSIPSRPNGLEGGMEVSWTPEDVNRFRDEDINVSGDAGVTNHPPSLADNAAESTESDPQALREVDTVRRPQGFVNHVTNFVWGDFGPLVEDEIVQQQAADNIGDRVRELEELDRNLLPGEGGEFDQEPDADAEAAAAAAIMDPEAVEDAEDLEGILELIGMRGPIAGLFQNAVFCAVLVSVTIFLCIFIPYNIGRMTVWAIANPSRLVRMAFSLSKFLQDLVVAVLGVVSYGALSIVYAVGWFLGSSARSVIGEATTTIWELSANATSRVYQTFVTEFSIISTSEMQNFSALSHEALISLKDSVSLCVSSVLVFYNFLRDGDLQNKAADAISLVGNWTASAIPTVGNASTTLLDPNSWVISFSIPAAASKVDPELAYWSGTDRFWAIFCGYIAVCFLAALYIRRGTPFSSGQIGQEWEASVIDLLNQASGVMKVILIISIEMLIFPLYCGLLLDAALLPLFENTSMKSRMLFTYNFPLTSIFVHWFVGTGYMFHFALFVSMCRKIMRKGVLYFIRDPDDPDFHPVRDVLERNVTTQLRKILFSAFVYGALVIVCLGGVVWGLCLTLPTVLPVHYSSNEPVLEFPIDLLFYNFLMPLAVKFFKPSDGLHVMYTWWFRKCARGLRITWFLFGERRIDEEGALALAKDSPHKRMPWWKKLFLEVDRDGEVVPKTWQDAFEGGTSRPISTISQRKMGQMHEQKEQLVGSGQLITDGRFVRSPASDQVKIPKGRRVFLDVSDANARVDGKPDVPETDLYSSSQYQLVYVPPHFRLRVFLFILFIWLFAAVTGVGFTIVPLVFGRRMFKLLIPAHIRTNDIYAFSIGIYILGSAAYSVFHIRPIYAKIKSWAAAGMDKVCNRDAPRIVSNLALNSAAIAYAYVILLFVFPMLLTAIMELYLIIPLHTYMYPLGAAQAPPIDQGGLQPSVPGNRHTVRVIQVWTLGLLYLKLGARILRTLYEGRPVAVLVRAVLRRGWLRPNVGVLTRFFVIPGLTIGAAAIYGPIMATNILLKRGVISSSLSPDVDPVTLAAIYRLSYPAAALAACGVLTLWSCVGVYHQWQARIRDEAYLIGERLHNFGIVTAGADRGRRAWRAGGPRL